MSLLKAERLQARRECIYAYLEQNGLDAALLVDTERMRNPSLRYLSGHPQDALLLLLARGKAILLPWDMLLAEQQAVVDELLPYTNYQRSLRKALSSLIPELGLASGSRVELSGKLSFPLVREIDSELSRTEILCQAKGIDSFLLDMRSLKDDQEIAWLREAARITNRIIAQVKVLLQEKGRELRELDLAMFLETQARAMGAEGMGFESLVASPGRSFAIHAFPSFTSQPLLARGFSIIDFGVNYAGYTSDVTLTIVSGRLDPHQEDLIRVVEEAYQLALSMVEPGIPPWKIAQAVDRFLDKQGYRMPHPLGHGIGLDPHERPLVRSDEYSEEAMPLADKMVFTIEPGLYDPRMGGIRLENDILLAGGKSEVLTEAQLIRC